MSSHHKFCIYLPELIHVRRSPIHIVVTVCDFLGGFVTCMPHTIEEYEEYFLVEPSPFPQMGHFSFRLMFKIVQTGFCCFLSDRRPHCSDVYYVTV